MKTILALGAHYDDIELGVAGTLFKHIKAGDNIYLAILVFNDERTAHFAIRRSEQIDAMDILCIPHKNLFEFEETDDEGDIVAALDHLNPDVVFCPYNKDSHHLHKRCSRVGQSLGRKVHTTTIFYAGGSTYDFTPDVFSIIDFDAKLEVLSCFKSQIAANAIKIDTISKRELYWGSLVGTERCYAEGFKVRKMRYGV